MKLIRLPLEFTWSVQVFLLVQTVQPKIRVFLHSRVSSGCLLCWLMESSTLCVLISSDTEYCFGASGKNMTLCVSEEWTKTTQQSYSMSALTLSPGLGLLGLSKPSKKKIIHIFWIVLSLSCRPGHDRGGLLLPQRLLEQAE